MVSGAAARGAPVSLISWANSAPLEPAAVLNVPGGPPPGAPASASSASASPRRFIVLLVSDPGERNRAAAVRRDRCDAEPGITAPDHHRAAGDDAENGAERDVAEV